MDVRVGLWRRLSTEELMLLNCGVGEDSWESLQLQGDQPVYPKGDQSWVFFGRADAKAPILWPPHVKNWLAGKDSDAGRDGGRRRRRRQDEMAGWHHQLDGHEFGWTSGVGDGQGGLVCCNSWGRKESDTTEQLNWTEMSMAPPIRTRPSFPLSQPLPSGRLSGIQINIKPAVVTNKFLEILMVDHNTVQIFAQLIIQWTHHSVEFHTVIEGPNFFLSQGFTIF